MSAISRCSILRLSFALALGLWMGGCAPVNQPDHCSHQAIAFGGGPCQQGQICTTSLCAGLGPVSQDDGCRAQEDVYAAAQASVEQNAYSTFKDCLVHMQADQKRMLRRIEQGEDVGLGPKAPEPSLGPASNCPEPEADGGTDGSLPSGQPGTSTSEYCVQDSDCASSSDGPHCDTRRGTCHQCVPGYQHCQDPLKPVCDEHLGHRSCQACSIDLDCIALGRGAHCRKRVVNEQYEPRCEACAQDFHCAQVPARLFCDSSQDDSPPRCVPCNRDEDCGSAFQTCEDHRCMGCRLDEECHPGSSCWSWPDRPGRCSSRVYYVDSDGNADCLTGNGTPARPFCRLNEAIAKIDNAEMTTIRVKGKHLLHRGVMLRSGSKLQLIGDGRARIEIDEVGQGLLTMSDNSQLRVAGINLVSRKSHVILCRGHSSQLRLEDAWVEGGTSSTLVIRGCSVQIHRSHLRDSQAYAVVAQDASVTMASSIVAGNGRIDHDRGGAFRLDGQVFLELEHTTVAGNHAEQEPAVIKCQAQDNQIYVRDSIVVRLDSVLATNCSETTTFTERNWSDVPVFSTGEGRFVEKAQVLYGMVRSPLTSDFRLLDPLLQDTVSQELSSLGQWNPGDSPFDIEGQRWSSGAGFVGADQSTLRAGLKSLLIKPR